MHVIPFEDGVLYHASAELLQQKHNRLNALNLIAGR